MIALEEAQGMGARLGMGLNLKTVGIISGVLLVTIIGGALIYKRIKK